jgi:hypothetical protein
MHGSALFLTSALSNATLAKTSISSLPDGCNARGPFDESLEQWLIVDGVDNAACELEWNE